MRRLIDLENPTSPLKTRLAPTPSGYLHLGNAVNFALTWMWARRHGAQILLRIDDIDRSRVRPVYVDDIFRSLEWLGLDWDEGPSSPDDFEAHWSQLHRRDLYDHTLAELANKNAIYACRCSRTEWANRPSDGCPCRDLHLSKERSDVVWRLNSLPQIHFTDRWMGFQPITTADLDAGTVMRRRDGIAAYQICSMTDDVHFSITHGIRGSDLLGSTRIQRDIASILGKEKFLSINWMHHPLVMHDGEKMSKSVGSQSLAYLRENGFDRRYVIEFLAKWLRLPNADSFEELASLIDWKRPNFIENPTT